MTDDPPPHRADVGAQVFGHLHFSQPHAEVVRRLVDRGVDGARHHQLGPADARALAGGAIPVGLDGDQQRLGAARGHRADAAVGTMEERGDHLDDLGLEALERSEEQHV